MGRPRKRRRAEIEDSQDPNTGAVELGDDNTSTTTYIPHLSTSEDFLPSSSNDQYGNGGVEALEEDNFFWDLPQALASGPMLEFSGWDPPQDLGHFLSADGETPMQLQTPPDSSLPQAARDATPAEYASSVAFPGAKTKRPATGPGCACLANLYLALSSFQSLPPPSFPLTSGTVKKATNLARDVLRCQQCPKAYASAFQNMMLLGTLLPLVVNEYANLLQHIDERSSSGKAIAFRMAEQSPELAHFHTGNSDCPLRFDIELSAAEWRTIARKVIKKDVLGTADNDRSLSTLVGEMEQRQYLWHTISAVPGRHSIACTNLIGGDEKETKGQRMCLHMVNRLRSSIKALSL